MKLLYSIIALLLFIPLVSATTFFYDDFDDGDLSDWTIEQQTDTKVNLSDKYNSSPYGLFMYDDNINREAIVNKSLIKTFSTQHNFNISFNINMETYFMPSNGRASFRLINQSNGVDLSLFTFYNGYIYFKNTSGFINMGAFNLDEWYNIEISRIGGGYYCYVNETEWCNNASMTLNDDAIGTHIQLDTGIASNKMNVTFDDIYISSNPSNFYASVYDEENNTLITDNITMNFLSGDDFLQTFYSVNGSFFIANLTDDNYSVSFSGLNYTTRSYSFELGNGIDQNLSAYLVYSGADSTVLTFKDKNNGAELGGVTVSIETFIDEVYTVVEVMQSDITGKVEFDYLPDVTYRFTAYKSGYETKIFTLSPILFDSYTVNMERSVAGDDDSDFSGINLVLSPDFYYNNLNNTVSLMVASPSGSLAGFGFDATFKTESVAVSSSNAYGGTLSDDLEIINASLNDLVVVNYFYELTDGTYKNFTRTYSVGDSGGSGLFDNEHYGMGFFTRLLVVTIVVLVVAGMVSMFSSTVAGGVSALLIWGFFVWINFIEFWVVATSVVVLLMILSWRSTQ